MLVLYSDISKKQNGIVDAAREWQRCVRAKSTLKNLFFSALRSFQGHSDQESVHRVRSLNSDCHV